MMSKITVNINDLLDLVNYTRHGEDEDFEENGGSDHIVHTIRRLASCTDGHTKSKITVDINDLVDLVDYARDGEEEDFSENGGRDHIVHTIRRLASRINGHRTTTNAESERMTEREYRLYATRRCSHVVEYGNGRGVVHCQEPVMKVRTGTFLERCECPEHVRYTADNYGPSAHH